jgi:uncharacterized protein YecE (DUF72 family)
MEAVIGTAGWSLASRHAGHFPGEGSALQLYAARFNGVEIKLHGSPIMYRSSYEAERVDCHAWEIGAELEAGREAWCMFDNTLSAFATVNALALMERA